MIERTLILLKPDTVQRGICGEIISRLERAGLKIVGMRMVWADRDFAKQHYAEHLEKPFYKGLEDMIVMGPVIAMVLEGVEAIELVRKMCGATEPKSANPGTIRGDYAQVSYGHADKRGIGIKNIVHASANKKDAQIEVGLWFTPEQLHTYKTVHEVHVFE
ncbi:nucleoside-diphosphate kinase [Candidatus Woesearchaeota archaeon]|jgi:nucleoside-diphosphate kinase|nr:nucleoside-diphosphate kinase [Candidatus Woesearchaeota archaeon]MBT6774920.1 nucleoside-diphosphate kinase [Candidatus Woesearchaeota archaeon]